MSFLAQYHSTCINTWTRVLYYALPTHLQDYIYILCAIIYHLMLALMHAHIYHNVYAFCVIIYRTDIYTYVPAYMLTWYRWRRWWFRAIIYGSLLLVDITVCKCSLAAVDCRQYVLHGVLQICGPVLWGDLVHCPSTLWVSAKVSSSVAAVVACRGTRPGWNDWNVMVINRQPVHGWVLEGQTVRT